MRAVSPSPDPNVSSEAADAVSAATRVFGVLGGIASGKSNVAHLLAGTQGEVIDADALAHEALHSPEVAAEIAREFGPELLDESGSPRRDALAALVFAADTGDDARRKLEGWIHPRVRARILERLGQARAEGVPVVVLDVPLLIENDSQHGLVRECDALIFVEVDGEERDRRARSTRGWAPGDVSRRESAQLPLDEKKRRAHHVIQNNSTTDELARAVRALIETLGLD